MSYKYFPQQLPKDIKDLQLDRLVGQQLIDTCDDPESPFYEQMSGSNVLER